MSVHFDGWAPDELPSGTSTVRNFSSLRVVCIGDVMLDSYLIGTADRLCREGPVPIVQRRDIQRMPGGAANTAANLRSLGAEVRLIGLAGTDDAGRALRKSLTDSGISDEWLLESSDLTTLHKLRIIADNQYVVRFDEGATLGRTASTVELLAKRLVDAARDADAIVVSDYGYGVLSETIVETIGKLRGDRSCPLIVDAKHPGRFPDLRPTLVTPNYMEAALAVDPMLVPDGSAPSISEVERLGTALIDIAGSDAVAVTLAERGACLVEANGQTAHIPAHSVGQANDVGAGDSFTAAAALALAAGVLPAEAIRIAVAASEIAVTKQRTAVVGQRELLRRVSLWDHDQRPAEHDRALERLASRLEQARLQGQTVVFTNGIFDILHAGHIAFLNQARNLGDLLVVGVNSDRSARALKGEGRPINTERDRLALIAALEPVEQAVLFDDTTPESLIRALRPDVHVKGGDYEGSVLPEASAVQEVGGEIVILPLIGNVSTTQMIDRIIAVTGSSNGQAEVAQ